MGSTDPVLAGEQRQIHGEGIAGRKMQLGLPIGYGRPIVYSHALVSDRAGWIRRLTYRLVLGVSAPAT
jgi:hypothetical protein